MSKFPIFSLGHSTRPIPEFIALLRLHSIRVVADIRTIPRSRRNPQYNADEFAGALIPAAIRYVQIPELGGLRHPKPDSPNGGWRNASFRGYADYMDSEAFACGLETLLALAQSDGPIAMVCAEAVPWRCHRSLVADALLTRHIPVEHIIGANSHHTHHLTPFARVEGQRVTYPPAQESLPL